QQVVPAVPVKTHQATLVALQSGVSVDIPVDPSPAALKTPEGQVRGGVQVDLRSSVGGVLPGVQAWLADYPYTCVEQLGAKAIGMQDTEAWDALMRRLPAYLDEDGLAAYFPGGSGNVALTAYLLSLTAEARALQWPYQIPEDPRERML